MKKVWALLLLFLFAPLSWGADNLGDYIIHHIANSDHWNPPYLPAIPLPAYFDIFGINMGLSLHVVAMLFSALLMLFLFTWASRRKSSAPISKLGHVVEALVIYLRDDLVVPNLGKKDAQKWLPFFLTLFFFILTLNLLGMFPGMPTATGNINFTAAMAIMVFVSFNFAGIFRNGPIHYFTNLVPKGIPFPVLIILAPIELMGLFTKTFALAIRLFANMSAGHIIIFCLLGLIAVLKSWFVVPISLGFALFIMLIEVLVAFLQAYVFTLLASLFVGMALHQEH